MTYVLPQGVYGSNQNSLYIYAKDKCFSCLQKIDKHNVTYTSLNDNYKIN